MTLIPFTHGQLGPNQLVFGRPLGLAAERAIGVDLDAGGQLDEAAFRDAGFEPVINRRWLNTQNLGNLGAASKALNYLFMCYLHVLMLEKTSYLVNR